MTFQRAGLLVLALLALGLVLRVGVSVRQSLWADEVFTLAMATGHSLEHPADAARPELGDFVQGDGARPAAEWARYVRFDSAGIAPRRILRAVALSDTSPPLYYLAVAVWLRVTGVRDSMLHLFSVFWWLLTVPLLWSLALEVGGPRAGRVALALYAIAPMSIYYGTEVRMYSMAWCLAALLAWISLRLSRNGGAGWLAGWVVTAAAGLLTHYFFVFPVAAAAVWLLSHSNRARRVSLLGAALAVAALVFWWYAGLPESLEAWRVTGGWLKGRLGPLDLLANGVKLVLAGLSSPGVAYAPTWVAAAGLAIVVAGIGYAAVRRLLPSCTPPVLLLLLTVAAAALGPVFVDALQGTYTSAIARYALAALPATIALFGGVLAAFPGRQPAAWIVALAVVWAAAMVPFVRGTSRAGEPFEAAALAAAERVGTDGLVLVHGIPSSVVGMAHYMPDSTPVAAWVGQLGERRMPDDLIRLVQGRDTVALADMHSVGEPMPQKPWLEQHRRLFRTSPFQDATVYYFAPVSDSTRR